MKIKEAMSLVTLNEGMTVIRWTLLYLFILNSQIPLYIITKWQTDSLAAYYLQLPFLGLVTDEPWNKYIILFFNEILKDWKYIIECFIILGKESDAFLRNRIREPNLYFVAPSESAYKSIINFTVFKWKHMRTGAL